MFIPRKKSRATSRREPGGRRESEKFKYPKNELTLGFLNEKALRSLRALWFNSFFNPG